MRKVNVTPIKYQNLFLDSISKRNMFSGKVRFSDSVETDTHEVIYYVDVYNWKDNKYIIKAGVKIVKTRNSEIESQDIDLTHPKADVLNEKELQFKLMKYYGVHLDYTAKELLKNKPSFYMKRKLDRLIKDRQLDRVSYIKLIKRVVLAYMILKTIDAIFSK